MILAEVSLMSVTVGGSGTAGDITGRVIPLLLTEALLFASFAACIDTLCQ